MKPNRVSGEPAPVATAAEVWLLGLPSLGDYLEFVKTRVIDGSATDPANLASEWLAANRYYQELEDVETGIADLAERRPLDPALADLAAEVKADPYFRQTFDTFPTTIELVELDRLIVFQKSVTWDFVEQLTSRIDRNPRPEELFRFCLPVGERANPVQIRQAGSRRYIFRSESTDLCFQGNALFRPEQIRDHASFGPVAGVVGVVVGFGSNFLNVIRADNRMLLHNGYHRACALRSIGITHAPAIMQTVTGGDELAVAARETVSRNPDFYFRSARPPLLKDFFDPKIRKVLVTPRLLRVIEVVTEVRDYLMPE